MRYDRERTFKLLQQRDWNALIALFKDNVTYDQIRQDDITRNILESQFVRELIEGSSFKQDPDYLFYLEQFHLLHTGPNFHFTLSANDVEQLAERIILGYRSTQVQSALRYAKQYPNLPISVELLREHERTQPKVVEHSQQRTIEVTVNNEIEPVDSTISLFKSGQEYEFYRAVREVYSTYLVFPNVAVSALVDFEQVKPFLDQSERNYFFKALVDCVVFDAENSFKPFKLLEIDSIYHDSKEQQVKDRMKDKIMAKAGQKLIRIRIKSRMSETDLTSLIREVTRS
ncbi:DUF2726 domain-containing protein [Fibrella arboris]|uniref:DUF2726 domain-containing protein n=1 Tax=Fibrella arboris TaxID=3242486 RepID=UPI00351F8FC7